MTNFIFRLLSFAALLAVMTSPSQAANEWGIEHEEIARFEANVVDILCELTGDCPKDCGAGSRQLGLVDDNGTLFLVPKNFDIFAGATLDLLPHCGKRVLADGLIIKNPKVQMFALQFVKPLPTGEWSRAKAFERAWQKDKAKGDQKANQWFRHDDGVKAIIAEKGIFGDPNLKAAEE